MQKLETESKHLQTTRMKLLEEKDRLEIKNSVDPIELMDVTLADVNQERNKLLRDFNELKDLGDMMIGHLAECQDCPVSRIYRELEI